MKLKQEKYLQHKLDSREIFLEFFHILGDKLKSIENDSEKLEQIKSLHSEYLIKELEKAQKEFLESKKEYTIKDFSLDDCIFKEEVMEIMRRRKLGLKIFPIYPLQR